MSTTCVDTASWPQRTANDGAARTESRTWILNDDCFHRETRKLKKSETYAHQFSMLSSSGSSQISYLVPGRNTPAMASNETVVGKTAKNADFRRIYR